MGRAVPLHFQIRVEGKFWDHVMNYVHDYATPNCIIHAANTLSEYFLSGSASGSGFILLTDQW